MPKLTTGSKTDILIHLGIIASAGLILFFAFFFLYLPWTTNHGKEILVPNLGGLTLDETEDVLDSKNLTYEVADCTYVNGKKPLTVFSQYPKENAGVKKGRKIFLTIISDKAPMVLLPDVIGRSENSARNFLVSTGLLVGKTEYIPAIEKNTVLKLKENGLEISPDTKIAKGSEITLVVGDGFGNKNVEVPNLVGLSYDEADVLVNGSSLNIGSILYDNTSDLPSGSVVRQRPEAGVNLKMGDAVNIWLSGN
jgi:eukaryotic-like serine/threonine-protein kinase